MRAAAKAMHVDLHPAATPSATVALLERNRTALGRVAQFAIARLKQSFKSDGMSAADIHAIIPDRHPAKKSKNGEVAAPTAPA